MKDKLYFVLTEEEYQDIMIALDPDMWEDLAELRSKLKEQYEANKIKYEPKTWTPDIALERKSKYE